MIFLFYLLIVALSIYSFVLIDPNLTIINHQLWAILRDKFVYIGYHQRELSSFIYLCLISLFLLFYWYLIKNYRIFNPLKIAIIIGAITLFSYPFLSRDFFNYLFDAKILTYYHQNPYLFKPLDFPADPWLRFMHWIHRSYPYGPVFLLLTLFPSFLSFGKLSLNYFLFKLMLCFFYILTVNLLKKINDKYAMIFATHPLIVIEGLINSHNDLIAVSLAIVGIYYIFKKRNVWARLLLILSAGIKYITLPFIFVSKSNKKINFIISVSLIVILIYLCLKMDFQPWYFLTIFALIPLYEDLITSLDIFFAGLLFSYYPYIRLGEGNSFYNVFKKEIILVFLLLNLLYILIWKISIQKNLKTK